MPLNLQINACDRLVSALSVVVPNLEVRNSRYIQTPSLEALLSADKALLSAGKVRPALAQYIGDTPFTDFVIGYLNSELARTREFSSEGASVPLAAIPGYEDSAAVSQRVLQAFESLPWEYMFSFEAPRGLASLLTKHGGAFSVAPNITLVSVNAEFRREYPPPLEPRLFSILGESNDLQDDAVFLQVQIKGFVGIYQTLNTEHQAFSLMKAFFGLGIACGVFVPRIQGNFGIQAEMMVHSRNGDRWEQQRESLYPRDWRKGIAGINVVWGQSEAEIGQLAILLNRIGAAFSLGARQERLQLAAEWLCDSYASDDQLLTFVQTMVVLEILLGDKAETELVGLGALLRNRCAYFIGETPAERDHILEELRKIYDVRSSIVHAGKRRLNANERQLFTALQRLCFRVIRKEVAQVEHSAVLLAKLSAGVPDFRVAK